MRGAQWQNRPELRSFVLVSLGRFLFNQKIIFLISLPGGAKRRASGKRRIRVDTFFWGQESGCGFEGQLVLAIFAGASWLFD